MVHAFNRPCTREAGSEGSHLPILHSVTYSPWVNPLRTLELSQSRSLSIVYLEGDHLALFLHHFLSMLRLTGFICIRTSTHCLSHLSTVCLAHVLLSILRLHRVSLSSHSRHLCSISLY